MKSEELASSRGPVTRRWQTWARSLGGYVPVASGAAGARALSFIATLIVARALGPADFGDFSVFFALAFVVSTAGDFVDVTYVRKVTSTTGESDMRLLRAATTIKVLLFGTLVVLSYPIAVLLARGAFGRTDLELEVVMAILCGSGLAFISLRASTFLAEQRYAIYALVASAYYVMILIVLLGLAALGSALTPTTVYVAFVGTSTVIGLLCFATILPSIRPLRAERDVIGPLLTFAKWLAAANLVQIVYQRLDVILLARYVDRDELGQYGAAIRLTVIASLMIGALSGFALPKVARTRESRHALSAYVRESLALSGGIVAVVGLLWLLTPFLVSVLFGEAFAPAAELARILLIGTALLAVSIPLGLLFLADEAPRHVLYIGLVRLALLLGLTIILAPRWGAEGAAWSVTVTEVIALAYVLAVTRLRWRESR